MPILRVFDYGPFEDVKRTGCVKLLAGFAPLRMPVR